MSETKWDLKLNFKIWGRSSGLEIFKGSKGDLEINFHLSGGPGIDSPKFEFLLQLTPCPTLLYNDWSPSIPTPRKVIGNSKGEGGPKSQIFKRKLNWNFQRPRVGGSNQKTLHGGVWIFSGKHIQYENLKCTINVHGVNTVIIIVSLSLLIGIPFHLPPLWMVFTPNLTAPGTSVGQMLPSGEGWYQEIRQVQSTLVTADTPQDVVCSP